MVGDNFFLNLAVFSMNFRMKSNCHVLQSGLCISGQTIDDVADKILEMDPNQIILLNIGSVDIMNGKHTIDLIISMMRLMNNCKLKEITPILTTLPPIANYRFPLSRVKIMNEFNDLLIKNPFNFPVIELHNALNNSDGKMDEVFYQSNPRFVGGFKKPIVLWNRMGRDRIMNVLKEEIGSAILKILLQ
jgi:maternal effect protein oskar